MVKYLHETCFTIAPSAPKSESQGSHLFLSAQINLEKNPQSSSAIIIDPRHPLFQMNSSAAKKDPDRR